MTAAVLREQARSARVTGAAGALVVAAALAMMVVAAPSHGHRPTQAPAGPAVLQPGRTSARFTQTLPPTTGPGIRP